MARAEQPDLMLVAGDLFDTAAPAPAATRLVTRALTALRDTGAEVVAIAGNHDNGAALDALRPWAEAAGITLRGRVRTAADHLITGTTADGEAWRLVALPFLSQRYAVRAAEMFALTAGRGSADLRRPPRPAHRRARPRLHRRRHGQPGDDPSDRGRSQDRRRRTGRPHVLAYPVPATIFPASAHYVALGHLHRAPDVPGPCPVRYSGSPLAVDFGEGANQPGVTIVEVSAHGTAKARDVPLTSAIPLRTVHGTAGGAGTARPR